MASDMISRKALVKAILAERDKISLEVVPRYGFGVPVPERHGQSMRGGIRKALHCVETAPAVDAVEVVRCKDCKHFDDGECTMLSEPKERREYERWETIVAEDDFCSCGERRDEDAD